MKYKKFEIKNYRAISGPMQIDLEKSSLTPIIGINECGKTTILQAILAFDSANDKLAAGRHLADTQNLYKTARRHPTISALIEISRDELDRAIISLLSEGSERDPILAYRSRIHLAPTEIWIRRNLLEQPRYELEIEGFDNVQLNDRLAHEIISTLPWTLYFDDFRDAVEDRIEITPPNSLKRWSSPWLGIMERLFLNADAGITVAELPTLEDRHRKSVIAKVKKNLNATLTKEWQNFRLDNSDPLEISIDYYTETTIEQIPRKEPRPPTVAQIGSTIESSTGPQLVPVARHFLKLEVIETDQGGGEHYFYIKDRSKGFFWFFNFVMKLEFNPKVVADHDDAIYLLDEPGSYLHASAQSKLCRKLRQLSTKNKVLYCTHSHYLLDPEVIPLSSIKVADKDANGEIRLVSIHEHSGNILERRSAFQPVVDALQIKPFLLDLTAQRVILTEGIIDYYAFEMFKGSRNLNILPSVGAGSIIYYISLMIAWRLPYVALWDNDPEGIKERNKAERIFGDDEAKDKFFLIPRPNGSGIRELQNLFASLDLEMIRNEIALPSNTSFEKTIASLFFAANRAELVNRITPNTRKNFEDVFDHLKLS